MKYTLYYGLNFDETLWGQPENEAGVLYLGTKGLLRFFEAHLGLEGHIDRIEHIRTEQYRQALSKYLKTHPTVFYKQSFEADQLACAEALLARRDELLLAGWEFKPHADYPRLNTIAEIEKSLTDAKKLIAGIADRFDAILQTVADNDIPIKQFFINEPEHLLPPQYRRLFEILRHKNVPISPIHPAQTVDLASEMQATDLNYFKDFIENKLPRGEKPSLNADGSIIVLEAQRDTDAADYFAAILKKNPHFQPVFIIPDKNRVLDDALIQNGLPSFGLPSSSLGRPTLQLLKLVTTFLWRPLDPYKILEFVTMPAKPLDSELATVIANLISQRPGIGSEYWFFAVENFFENLNTKDSDSDSDKPKNPQKIRQQYDFWFDRPTYDIEKSAPKEQIIEIFDYLKTWASEEFEANNGKNTSLIVLSEQARRVQEFLEELPPNDKFLSYLELERIIRTIYEPAPIQPRPCELGHYPYFHKESNIINPTPTLAWWNFTDTEGVHFFSRWYKNETAYLAQNEVHLQTPQEENALMLWQRILPVLKTEKQLVLIAPKKINGKDCLEHPLMSHLKACFGKIKPIIIDIDKNLNDLTALARLKVPHKVAIEYHQLGKTPTFVELFARQLNKRHQETLTSLETLFYYPYQWVFRHKAKLNKSPILSIVKENTLKGNVAHRFFELVLKEDFREWTRLNVDEWVEQHSRRLFQREAATLMMYGYEPERVQLIRQLKYAIWSLISLIRQNNWSVMGTEVDLKGKFSDIPVVGKADIVLERPSPTGNGMEFCILDLKWSGHTYRERLIKNGEDLQLVMYSRLLTEDEDWAHTAYFIIENARLLARNTLAFNDIRPLLPDVNAFQMNAQIWERMQKTFEWRLAQIEQGRIEIRTHHTAQELEEIYGDELIHVLEMKNDDAKFDDFRTLIGLVK